MKVDPPVHIENIKKHLRELPEFSTFTSNDDFMIISTQLMNYALYLQKIGISIAPNENMAKKGVLKRQAVIMGHMVRQYKLYEGFLSHVDSRQLELAAIYIRLIYETNVRIDYFFKTKASSTNSYIFTSYRPERESIIDLEQKAARRPLIEIEKRILTKIKNRLRRDRISKKMLLANKNWKIDNKSFKDILIFLNREKEYSYIFGSGSHFIHGGWYELSNHHLIKRGKYYQPDLDYDDPDPRVTSSISALCMMQLSKYIKWRKSDPENYITFIVDILYQVFIDLDSAHEKFYQERYTT